MTRTARARVRRPVGRDFLEQDDIATRSLLVGEVGGAGGAEVEELWCDLTPDRARKPHEFPVEYQLGTDAPHLARTDSIGRCSFVLATGRRNEAPLRRGSIWFDVSGRRVRLDGFVASSAPAELDQEGRLRVGARLVFEFDGPSSTIAALLFGDRLTGADAEAVR